MNSRNWVYLFLTTLMLGGISTIIVGFAVKWDQYQELFLTFNIIEILSVLIWLLGVGLIFSLISQMGFFAYLTVHRFGLGFFRSVWSSVQLFIIAVVLFDFVYLRYDEGDSLSSYIVQGVLVLVYGIIVSYIKMKQTNKAAFIPALFFIVVVTILEWVPALRADEKDWLLLMIFPLLLCNTWQLLILHKLNEKSQKADSK